MPCDTPRAVEEEEPPRFVGRVPPLPPHPGDGHLTKTLYIDRIPKSIDEDMLYQDFKVYGCVLATKVYVHKYSKKRSGFVEFESSSAAVAVMAILTKEKRYRGTEIHASWAARSLLDSLSSSRSSDGRGYKAATGKVYVLKGEGREDGHQRANGSEALQDDTRRDRTRTTTSIKRMNTYNTHEKQKKEEERWHGRALKHMEERVLQEAQLWHKHIQDFYYRQLYILNGTNMSTMQPCVLAMPSAHAQGVYPHQAWGTFMRPEQFESKNMIHIHHHHYSGCIGYYDESMIPHQM